MRTIIASAFTLVLSISCEPRRDNESKDFAQLKDKLPQIETPITYNSNGTINYHNVRDLSDFVGNKLLDSLNDINGYTILGKIFEAKKYLAIVGYIPDDAGTPVVLTINSEGKVIDSFFVFKTVGFDIGFYKNNCVTIFPDKTIHFIDSTLTRKINTEGTNEIPGTDSLNVITKNYKITESGIFEEVP